MKERIMGECGIREVSSRGEVFLSDSMLLEIKMIVDLEKKNITKGLFKTCNRCHYHIEAKNDFCEKKGKRTLYSDLCDQFKQKIVLMGFNPFKIIKDEPENE